MKVERFTGKYDFLSNFYYCLIKYEGVYYPSVEHAFQSAKTSDPKEKFLLSITESCKEVKKAGKKVHLRPDWEVSKLSIMETLIRYKFTRYEDLRKKLLATEDMTLIEGNSWGDTYWGVCNGIGENHLGKILMKIRKELRDEDN